MSHVVPLLPQLTVNGAFMEEFLAAPRPCGALGRVEVQRRTCGFLAIRPDAILSAAITAAGFGFGHSLLGASQYTVVQFVFEFYGFARYHLLVRPDHPIVRTVLARMVDSDEFFFFALDGNGTVTTFNADPGRVRDADRAGLRRNLPHIRRAAATEAPVPGRPGAVSGQPGPTGGLAALGVPRRRAVSGPDRGPARNDPRRVNDPVRSAAVAEGRQWPLRAPGARL